MDGRGRYAQNCVSSSASTSLRPGTSIIVRGYQSKDHLCTPQCRANGRDLTLENGQKLFMGSSGTGAPKDGSEKN